MIEQVQVIERPAALSQFQFLLQHTRTWVLVVTGLDGIGKSWFLERIKTYYTQDIMLSLTIDFADTLLCQDPLSVMEIISEHTAYYCNLDAVNRFRQELKKARDYIRIAASRRDTIMMSIDASNHSVVSKSSLHNIHSGAEYRVEEVKKQSLAVVCNSLCLQLLTFGEHVSPHPSHKKQRLLLCLDECQKLNRDTFKWVVDSLIKTIHQRLSLPHSSVECLVVGASRTQLSPEAIKPDEIHALDLTAFVYSDVEPYLQTKGIKSEHCQIIYTLTSGHPLCLSLAVEIYQAMQQEDVLFDKELFIKRFYQRAWDELIQAKVTRDLEKLYAKVIYNAAFADYFTDNILRQVLAIPQGTNSFKYHELTGLPIVVRIAGHHTIHPLIRRIITEYEKSYHPEECKHAKHYRKRFQRLCKQQRSLSLSAWLERLYSVVGKCSQGMKNGKHMEGM